MSLATSFVNASLEGSLGTPLGYDPQEELNRHGYTEDFVTFPFFLPLPSKISLTFSLLPSLHTVFSSLLQFSCLTYAQELWEVVNRNKPKNLEETTALSLFNLPTKIILPSSAATNVFLVPSRHLSLSFCDHCSKLMMCRLV